MGCAESRQLLDEDSHCDEELGNESGPMEERTDVDPNSDFAKCVCQLYYDYDFRLPGESENHKQLGTGFLGYFDNSATNEYMYGLFSNNHVLETKFMQYVVANDTSYITLTFDNIKEKQSEHYRLKPEMIGIIFTCPVLDVTFVQILNEERNKLICEHGRKFLHLLSQVQLSVRDRLTIIQHPNYGQMKIATNSHDGLYGLNVAHHVSTARGSSGSPVFVNESNEVVGVHKGGKKGGLNHNAAVSSQSVIEGIVAACRFRMGTTMNATVIGPPKCKIPRRLKVKKRCSSFTIYQLNGRYCTPTSYGWYWTRTDPGTYHDRFPVSIHKLDWSLMSEQEIRGSRLPLH